MKKKTLVKKRVVSIEKTYDDEQRAYVEILPAQEGALHDLLDALYAAGRIDNFDTYTHKENKPLEGLPALLNYLMSEYDVPAEALKAVNEGNKKYDFRIVGRDAEDEDY